MFYCYHCNAEWKGENRPGRTETCSQCDNDLHCCKNCHFYDKTSYNDCREPLAERVLDKEKSNFCSYYRFKKLGESGENISQKEIDGKSAFNSLFKD